MIGDRQAVALRRPEQVLARARGSRGTSGRCCTSASGRSRPYLTIWKCSSSWSGRSTIRTAGLLLDQADQADRPAGDGVGDEQLLAVDDVLVAVEHGRASSGRSGRTRRRARSGRRPRAVSPLARRGQESAPSARACRTSGAGRRPRCSRGPTPARRRSGRSWPSGSGTGENAANGAPLAAVLRIDRAGPSSRPRPGRPRRRRRSCRRSSKQRPGVAVPADDLQRLAHRPLARRARPAAARARTGRPGTSRSQTARWIGLLAVW